MPWSDTILTTLTLPATAGPGDPRIVLNGATGMIEFYGVGGVLIATIDVDTVLNVLAITGGSIRLETNQAPHRIDILTSGSGPIVIQGADVSIDALLSTLLLTANELLVQIFGNTDFQITTAGDDILIRDAGAGTSIGVPRGQRQSAFFAANSGAIGAEAIVLTLPNAVYREGRAYELIIGGRYNTSAASAVTWQTRRVNLAGAILSTFGNNTAAAAVTGEALYERTVLRRAAGGGDLTETLVVTAAASAGTVTMLGAAGRTRYVELRDIGAEADHPEGTAV